MNKKYKLIFIISLILLFVFSFYISKKYIYKIDRFNALLNYKELILNEDNKTLEEKIEISSTDKDKKSNDKTTNFIKKIFLNESNDDNDEIIIYDKKNKKIDNIMDYSPIKIKLNGIIKKIDTNNTFLINLENINDFYLCFNLYDIDSKEIVFSSGVIPPEFKIEKIKLNNAYSKDKIIVSVYSLDYINKEYIGRVNIILKIS